MKKKILTFGMVCLSLPILPAQSEEQSDLIKVKAEQNMYAH